MGDCQPAPASAVLGELVSTFALKNLLTQLGEVTVVAPTPLPVPAPSVGAAPIDDSSPDDDEDMPSSDRSPPRSRSDGDEEAT